MRAKPNLELKVGIFVFIGLIILTLAVFSISEIHLFRQVYNIKVRFSFASGIAVGALARVAGVEAGEVQEIEMTYDKDRGQAQIVLSVWLDGKVKIPRDSRAYVNVLGLIGDTYLEIIPGEDYAHPLKEGEVLVGQDPISTETMMQLANKVADNFDTVLNSLNEVLDEDAKAALQETIHNFRDFSQSVKVIAARLERGEGKLGAWLKPKKSRKKK